jgi:acyl-CoA thioesterase FadM
MTSNTLSAPANWTPFVHHRDIFWADIDPANIAYTGRLSDFLLQAIEIWYRDRLGTDWYAMTVDQDLGTPFVHMELDFKSPVTPREPLATTVLVTKFGRSSVSYSARAHGAQTGMLRFTGAATNVWVRASTMKPIAIPETYRAVFEHEAGMAKGLLDAE